MYEACVLGGRCSTAHCAPLQRPLGSALLAAPSWGEARGDSLVRVRVRVRVRTPTLALSREPNPERSPNPRHYEEALYVFEQHEEMRNRSLWRPRFTPVSFSLLLTACAEVRAELALTLT